jgi:hypothetical protein
MCFVRFSGQTPIFFFLNSIDQLVSVMETICVFFALRTEFLNTI